MREVSLIYDCREFIPAVEPADRTQILDLVFITVLNGRELFSFGGLSPRKVCFLSAKEKS